jgi:hypothetical protein
LQYSAVGLEQWANDHYPRDEADRRNISRHITAEMTVGNAHGTSTAALTRSRPLKARFIASAMPSPIKNSRNMLITVKIKVFASPSRKSGFWNIST